MKIRKIILAAAIALLLFAGFILVRTFTYRFDSHDKPSEERVWNGEIPEKAVKRLADAIRIPTISTEVYAQTDFEPFDRFKEFLIGAFPLVYENTDTVTINKYALVFRWAGKDPNAKPLLFIAHYDVVPVSGYDMSSDNTGAVIYKPDDKPLPPVNETQTEWKYPPFSGAVADGRVYGRGTLDDKGILMALMEAAEQLMEQGYVPEQDIWFAFGHDEEVSGEQGAMKITDYFMDKGISFDAVYDEGGIITAPGMAGINSSLALVGTAEKGFMSLRITVRARGGHSSMPPAKSSLVLAAEIIEKLNGNQMPAKLIPPMSSFLDKVGGEMDFMSRMAIANKWALKPVLLKVFSGNPATNALVRTTTAITMAKGSDAANVLASAAEITVNFRLLPGDKVADVVKHVNKICDGYDAVIDVFSSREASEISPADTPAFEAIRSAMAGLYPASIVTPYITVAGTDAYKYQPVSDNIYRFMPVMLNDYEQNTMHNENEHITIENYVKMIEFYKALMRR